MEGRLRPLARIKDLILDGLFPRFCLRCEKEGRWFCDDCLLSQTFPPLPSHCVFCHADTAGHRTCFACQSDTGLDGCLSLGWYKDRVLQQAVRLWKYHGDPSLWTLIQRWISQTDIFSRLPDGPWTISPIPLHTARARERGFDQAAWIAWAVAAKTGHPFQLLLRRSEWTDPQAQRGTHDRERGDLDGIFQVRRDLPNRILLCDDVVTSGATLSAASRALKAAGVETVWGFTLARAK